MPNYNVGLTARKSERALLTIPIYVEGEDVAKVHFSETAYTLIVNRDGGLIATSHVLQIGGVIRITNMRMKTSCSFRVVARAEKSLSGVPEWGVKSLEPQIDIWGVYFPAKNEELPHPDLIDALLECQECSSREMAQITVAQYRRLITQSHLQRYCPQCGTVRKWRFGFVEIGPDDISPSFSAAKGPGLTPRDKADKRREKRMVVKLPIRIRDSAGREVASTTENISKSGICFACSLNEAIGETVHVNLESDGSGIQRAFLAHILWRRPIDNEGTAIYGARLEEVI